jgi:hypothetical protein
MVAAEEQKKIHKEFHTLEMDLVVEAAAAAIH